MRPLDDWAGAVSAAMPKPWPASPCSAAEETRLMTQVCRSQDAAADAAASLRSLSAHLLETWEAPPALHSALSFTGAGRSARSLRKTNPSGHTSRALGDP